MNLDEEIKKLSLLDDDEGILNLIIDASNKDSENADLLLRLAICYQEPPIDFYTKSLEITNESIRKFPKDIRFILLQGWIEDVQRGEVSDNTIEILNERFKEKNVSKQQYAEQIHLLRAFYYRPKNESSYVNNLQLSIENDPNAVENYRLLAFYYFEHRKKKDGFRLLNQAIKNVKLVYEEHDYVDTTDFDEFIDEFYKGTSITSVSYESLKRGDY